MELTCLKKEPEVVVDLYLLVLQLVWSTQASPEKQHRHVYLNASIWN